MLQAAISEQRHARAPHRCLAVVHRDRLRFDRDNAAGNGSATADRDLRAFQGCEQRRWRGERAFVERQVLEGLFQRLSSRQAETTDAALVVVYDEAFQYVVDLLEPDRELQGRVYVNRCLVFEIAETTGRQHHAFQRKILRLRKDWARTKHRERHGQ